MVMNLISQTINELLDYFDNTIFTPCHYINTPTCVCSMNIPQLHLMFLYIYLLMIYQLLSWKDGIHYILGTTS